VEHPLPKIILTGANNGKPASNGDIISLWAVLQGVIPLKEDQIDVDEN
jgi:hypothetical protein